MDDLDYDQIELRALSQAFSYVPVLAMQAMYRRVAKGLPAVDPRLYLPYLPTALFSWSPSSLAAVAMTWQPPRLTVAQFKARLAEIDALTKLRDDTSIPPYYPWL